MLHVYELLFWLIVWASARQASVSTGSKPHAKSLQALATDDYLSGPAKRPGSDLRPKPKIDLAKGSLEAFCRRQ